MFKNPDVVTSMYCIVQKVREDSITGWMFGFDPTNPGESIPSIAGDHFFVHLFRSMPI